MAKSWKHCVQISAGAEGIVDWYQWFSARITSLVYPTTLLESTSDHFTEKGNSILVHLLSLSQTIKEHIGYSRKRVSYQVHSYRFCKEVVGWTSIDCSQSEQCSIQQLSWILHVNFWQLVVCFFIHRRHTRDRRDSKELSLIMNNKRHNFASSKRIIKKGRELLYKRQTLTGKSPRSVMNCIYQHHCSFSKAYK